MNIRPVLDVSGLPAYAFGHRTCPRPICCPAFSIP
jgi:hypothetical protein